MVGAVVCGEFSVYSTLWGMVEVDLVVAHSFAHVRWGQRQLELDFSRIMRDMYIVRRILPRRGDTTDRGSFL